MKYVEFLEFLARLAWLCKIPEQKMVEIISGLKDGKEELCIPDKLEYLLDVLFKQINCKRKSRDNLKD